MQKGTRLSPLLTVRRRHARGELGKRASAIHGCHWYTPLVKISHLMGTTRIGITRAWALGVLLLLGTLQCWDLGLQIPQFHGLIM